MSRIPQRFLIMASPRLSVAICFILSFVVSISASNAPVRPRGVAKSRPSPSNRADRIEAQLYLPSEDGSWKCLDGSLVISFDQVNDVHS